MKNPSTALMLALPILLVACGSSPETTSEDNPSRLGEAQGSETYQESEPFAYPCQADLLAEETAEQAGFISDTQWEIGPLSFPVPYSASAGGCEVLESGVRAGFARTPDGATLAALTAVSGYAPGYSQEQLDDLEAKIANVSGISTTRSGAENALNQTPDFITSTEAEVFAYRLEHFTSDEAQFTVFLRTREGNRIVAFAVPLIWEAGDWKVSPTAQNHYYLDVTLHQGALGEVVLLPVTTAEQVTHGSR